MASRFFVYAILASIGVIFMSGCAPEQVQEVTDKSGKVIGETGETREGELPSDLQAAAKAFCREKVAGCEKHAGWFSDVQVSLKNLATGASFTFYDVRKGGCPRESGAGIYPVNVKSETNDYQGVRWEFVCSGSCEYWTCEEEPPPRTAQECAPDFPNPAACAGACVGEGRICRRISEGYPACWRCTPQCNLDTFAACAKECVPPQKCIEKCPLIPVECPPDSPADVVGCARLDEVCSRKCLATANACVDACLQKSHCTMEQIPPALFPA